jgi:hypothetical protein
MGVRERNGPKIGLGVAKAKSAGVRRNPQEYAAIRAIELKKTPTQTSQGLRIGGGVATGFKLVLRGG